MQVEPADERLISSEIEATRFWVFLDRNQPGTDQAAYRDSYRISGATIGEAVAWAKAQNLDGGRYRVAVEVPGDADEVGVVWLGAGAELGSD